MKADETKPTLYMLAGIPGSGKSTWLLKNYSIDADKQKGMIASTDNYIEQAAKEAGSTYNDVFQSVIKDATAEMYKDLELGIRNGMDIYWDQTNLTVKSRRGKLAKIPAGYKTVAVIFPIPEEKELERRLANRPGKTVPDHIMRSMINSFESPTEAEGFDQVIFAPI